MQSFHRYYAGQLCLSVGGGVALIALLRFARSRSARLAMLSCVIERSFGSLARRPAWACLGVAALVLAGRALLLPFWGVPRPAIADEFSYLLMADTFASGRLANPPHPMWTHFETLFVLQQPTYSSVYPVAQGAILAFGSLLTGCYWVGVWLSMAAMCGASCWMMRAWLPPKWALFGSLFMVLQIGIGSYWMNSYWGGAHAAAAGALVLGSARRLQRAPRIRDSVLLGLGLVILANSRPWEGLAFSLPVLAVLAIRWPRFRRIVLLPPILILAIGAGGIMYYFNRVTGDAFRMPSQVYIHEYAATPAFIWQRLRPEPAYRHRSLRNAHVSFLPEFYKYGSLAGIVKTTAWKLLVIGNFFLGPFLAIPLILIPWSIGDRRMRLIAAALAAAVIAIAVTVPFQPHYAAPISAAIFAMTVQALRRLWLSRGVLGTVGYYLVPAIPAISFLLLASGIASGPPDSPMAYRAGMEAALEKSGALHLIIVRYASLHALSNEWVYNAANIDRAPVVWARDMGPEKNRELATYFQGRKIWLLEPDTDPRRLLTWNGD